MLLLPQMPNVDTVLVQLVEEWIAHWCPSLFPHIEGAKWVHRAEYEIPRVLELQAEMTQVKKHAERETERIEAKIAQIREDNQDWYTLLQGTGDELKDTVIRSLQKIGFSQVVDVDEEAKANDESTTLREDIQVLDASPTLIIDVKGVRGHPDDDEARQAEKHALMRIREWKRADIQPLTIINHQRHLPPHNRDAQAFRDEIIGNAEDTKLGLMTTWDLFRILRNKDALNWPIEVVTPIFYRTGRIDPVPEHYSEIGTIVKVWQTAFSIIPSQNVSTGIRMAVETGDTFIEFAANSVQIDRQDVEKAPAESQCGIGFEGASETLHVGQRVFVITPHEA